MGLVVALSLSCQPAPPPPPEGEAAATPPPADTAQPTPDTGLPMDTVPGTAPPADTSRRMATLDDLRAEIMRMVADLRAADVGHCRATPFGAKPCGGPRQYLVYSADATDSAALASAVSRYNELEAETNRREGRVSDCMMVTPPRVALVSGRCSQE